MLMFVALLASCGFPQTNPAPVPNMPNLASVFCEEHGGKLEFKKEDWNLYNQFFAKHTIRIKTRVLPEPPPIGGGFFY